MNINVLSATTAVALAITAVPALAATITFDSFIANQGVVSSTDAPVEDTLTHDSIYGGERVLIADNELPSGDLGGGTRLEVFDGELAFSNDNNATGIGTVRYTFAGLEGGNANLLSFGTNPYFTFGVGDFDNDYNALFTALAVDSAGNRITYSENLQGPFNPNLFLTQFAGIDDFNLAAVDSIEFALNTDATGQTKVDGSLNSISLTGTDVAPIPLPASGLLLLAGMGGMSLLRRRRKA